MTTSLLPPRKKNQKVDHPQVGIFVRTREGGVIEYVTNAADDDLVKDVIAAFNNFEKRGGTESKR